MDDIVFENVVVAADQDRLVRGIVDQVMGRSVADALELNRVRAGQLVLGESPNVVIQCFVTSRRQRLPVATGQEQAAGARIVDVARFHAVALAAGDANAHLADVLHHAGLDSVGHPAFDGHAVAL